MAGQKPRTKDHISIYKLFFGEIPSDEDGRRFDVHHIDGNSNNNSICNLIAVSIQDHYDIHLTQGDYAAALRIAQRLGLPLEEKRKLSKLNAIKRVKDGTHNFLRELNPNNYRIENGTHNFLGRSMNDRQLSQGKHISQVKVTCESCNKTMAIDKFLMWGHGKNCAENRVMQKKLGKRKQVVQIYKTCPKCNQTMSMGLYVRWKHGENCDK